MIWFKDFQNISRGVLHCTRYALNSVRIFPYKRRVLMVVSRKLLLRRVTLLRQSPPVSTSMLITTAVTNVCECGRTSSCFIWVPLLFGTQRNGNDRHFSEFGIEAVRQTATPLLL